MEKNEVKSSKEKALPVEEELDGKWVAKKRIAKGIRRAIDWIDYKSDPPQKKRLWLTINQVSASWKANIKSATTYVTDKGVKIEDMDLEVDLLIWKALGLTVDDGMAMKDNTSKGLYNRIALEVQSIVGAYDFGNSQLIDELKNSDAQE